MNIKNYKIVEFDDTEKSFAVVKEDGGIIICQEDWMGNDYNKIHLSKRQIIELAEKIR